MNKEFLDRFHHGEATDAYQYFGAHLKTQRGQKGTLFTLYAPHAVEVEIIGDFNHWIGVKHKMERLKEDPSIWQLFIPNVENYTLYKYHILTSSGSWIDKSDPYAFFSECPPQTASKVFDLRGFPWKDKTFLAAQTKNLDRPLSIYEVHLGSWKKKNIHEYFSYEEIAQDLISYVKENEFTHIEFLPLLEHPFDGSWGYQCTGYYSATARYGNPKQLMYLIEQCHLNQIGVIMDFVPVHFVKDAHGLHMLDGQPLYEYDDEFRRYSEWGSVHFNLYKEEVRSFLMSSVAFWIHYFHIDGVRFDAVSNLIYWNGRKDYGNNDGALEYIKRSNYLIAKEFPNVMLIAEDSSDFQGVTKPTFENGLGFDYKWDLGWMNDTLHYYKLDPIYRKYKHHQITFSMHYFYSERFLLPLSHDEVVHLKGSIINKMWGNYYERFAQARNLYAYMFLHPGKKLNFMGNEFGHMDEWMETKELSWNLYDYDMHKGLNRLFKDLNSVYKFTPVLHQNDYDSSKFHWIMANNGEQSIYAFARFHENQTAIVLLNMTPVGYPNYELGVPFIGTYEEVINTDRSVYGGSDFANYSDLSTISGNRHDYKQYIRFNLAPFAAILLLHQTNK